MEELAELLGIGNAELLQRVLWTLGAVVVYVVVRLVVRRLSSRHLEDHPGRFYTVNKLSNYVLGFVFLVVLLAIWTRGGTGLAAYLGIVSAGLAIALQDPLTNLAGWLFILVRRPFLVGDRIQVGEHRGDVIDLRLFQFSIVEIGNWVDADQSTGRVIHLPNGAVFRQPVANYTQDFAFIWDEIPVTVTFESDWQAAKEILTGIVEAHTEIRSEEAAAEVRKASRKFRILYQHLTPIVWTTVADHGVTLTLRYLAPPRSRRSVATEIWEDILVAFAGRDDIDFAYPTQRFYDNAREGKPQAGGPAAGGSDTKAGGSPEAKGSHATAGGSPPADDS